MLFVAGIDEAGRGPLAGPVTAAAVVLPQGYSNQAITDSKKLTAEVRDELFKEIVGCAISYAVVSVGHHRILRHNIRVATRIAMEHAAARVKADLDTRYRRPKLFFLIDGNMPIDSKYPNESIIDGDEKILSISSASIIAKVTRDRLMAVLDNRFPAYGFSAHKGYGTPKHLRAISEHGPCRVHRKSFRGVREHLSPKSPVETAAAGNQTS